MSDNYKHKYNKYKFKYLLARNKINLNNLYLLVKNQKYSDELAASLSNSYNVIATKSIDEKQVYHEDILIADTWIDCNRLKLLFKKIILLSNSEEIYEFDKCSITCEIPTDIIDYLNLPNYNLGFTYLMDGNSGMRKLTLHKKLRSWDIKYGFPSKVDYLYLDLHNGERYDRRFYPINSTLRNFIDIKAIQKILNKDELYFTMKDTYSDYLSFMAETRYLNQVNKLSKDEILIVRPVGTGAFGGKGILIVTNDDELTSAKEEAKKSPHWKWIASKYINNPMLYDGKKFNLKCYFMMTTFGKFHKFNNYEIMTAPINYTYNDFSNKKMHDPRRKYGIDHFYSYPTNISDKRIEKEVSGLQDRIINIIKKYNLKSYEESKYGYMICSIDVLVDSNYHAWLIEVNNKVEHQINIGLENLTKFEEKFLSWEYEKAIKPIFSKIILQDIKKQKVYRIHSNTSSHSVNIAVDNSLDSIIKSDLDLSVHLKYQAICISQSLRSLERKYT